MRAPPARTAGYADCNNDLNTDGCETLLSTPGNCGKCNYTCPSTYTCDGTLRACVKPATCNVKISFNGLQSNVTHVLTGIGQGTITLNINAYTIVSANLLSLELRVLCVGLLTGTRLASLAVRIQPRVVMCLAASFLAAPAARRVHRVPRRHQC